MPPKAKSRIHSLSESKVSDQEALKMVVIEKCIRKLYLNNYNYAQTAREMNIGPEMLRRYAMKYGKQFLGDAWAPKKRGPNGVASRSDELLMESTVPMQIKEAEAALLDRNAKIIEEATKAQIMAINRIKVLLGKSNILDTVEALRALNEIAKEPQEEVQKRSNSFLQFVQNQIIQTSNPDKK